MPLLVFAGPNESEDLCQYISPNTRSFLRSQSMRVENSLPLKRLPCTWEPNTSTLLLRNGMVREIKPARGAGVVLEHEKLYVGRPPYRVWNLFEYVEMGLLGEG